MIFDTLANAKRYFSLHPLFSKAFSYLQREKFSPGREFLEKEDLFAIHEEVLGKGREKALLEAHQKYIDIQYVLEGQDEMGWIPKKSCKKIFSPYDEEKDRIFFSETPLVWVPVPKGFFVVFFPEDAHAPLAGKDFLKKIVMKVLLK